MLANRDEVKSLADDINVAIGKGHRGYTIRGPQMSLVVKALQQMLDGAEKPVELRVNAA